MDRSIKLYIQDLNIDTVNTLRHLDTKIIIALAHKKISQIKPQTQQTLYTNDNYI